MFQVTVFWTSPPRGSGCIDFKAMVVERQDVWYMDDGGLTWTMCEDDSPLAEPTVIYPDFLLRSEAHFEFFKDCGAVLRLR